jgi:hypothetical protein
VSGKCRKLNVPLHCAGTPRWANCSYANTPNVILGCPIGGSICTGTASACSTHSFKSGANGGCLDQSGCQWNSASGPCTGTPIPCSQFVVAPDTCTSYNGCTLSAVSSGTPTPCSQVSAAECPYQRGCQVTDVGVY